MNKEKAISFLTRHSPMGKDEFLDEETLNEYRSVLNFFKKHRDFSLVELIIKSFGEFDGGGSYEEAVDILKELEEGLILPLMKKYINDKNNGVAYWVTILSLYYPTNELLPYLRINLTSKNSDIKTFSYYSLIEINSFESLELLHSFLSSEKDTEIVEEIKEALE